MTSELEDTAASSQSGGSQTAPAPEGLPELHCDLAMGLASQGAYARAFAELERVSALLPEHSRLIRLTSAMGWKAGMALRARELLGLALPHAAPELRSVLHRRLAWLHRKEGQLYEARAELGKALEARPADELSRSVLKGLLYREQLWSELDSVLEEERQIHLENGKPSRAARAAFKRGQLASERLEAPVAASEYYNEAAEHFAEASDGENEYAARVLSLGAALKGGVAPVLAREKAEKLLRLAQSLGKPESARRLLSELNIPWTESELSNTHSLASQMVAAADDAEAAGRGEAAAALLSAAGEHSSEADIKLEALFVGRAAWRDLAQLYRDRAEQAAEPSRKLPHLTKLAELLEDELADLSAAAEVYQVMFELSGDAEALAQKMRLLKARADETGVRRLLDLAVERSTPGPDRASALLARAESAAAAKQFAAARDDFADALTQWPSFMPALAGLAEVSAALGDLGAYEKLRLTLRDGGNPIKSGREELLRRLARLAGGPAAQLDCAVWAWNEVAALRPGDAEARNELERLHREAGNESELEGVFREHILYEPRSEHTRRVRLELVEYLERDQRADEALEELRKAVRADPSHRLAWLELSERLIHRGVNAEAALALQHAASSTTDDAERAGLWRRLAAFCRDTLKDFDRADACLRRAEATEALIRAREEAEREEATEQVPITAAPEAEGSQTQDGESSRTSTEVFELPPAEAALSGETLAAVQVAPSRMMGAQESTDTEQSSGVSNSPARHLLRREALMQRVQKHPLDAEGYFALAEFYEGMADAERSRLMAEIAEALEGDVFAMPRAPRLSLAATDRAGLRHPLLRSEAGELLYLTGQALLELFPELESGDSFLHPFHPDLGPGAGKAAEALLAAVRVLGLRSPDVFEAEQNGPPFSLTYHRAPKLWVGKLAVKAVLPDAELRFFAGRALFMQSPELMVLRLLRRDQIAQAMAILGQALQGYSSREAERVRVALPEKSLARIAELYSRLSPDVGWTRLSDAARYSINRAGLVACGAVAPALAALRGKRALPKELVELIRFAASERYLELRSRLLG